MMQGLRRILFRPPTTPLPENSEVIAHRTVKQTAWSESNLYSGAAFPKYNPDLLISRKGHDIYRKIMLDEQVKAVVKFKRDAITSRNWYFEFKKDVPLSEAEADRRVNMFTEMLDVTEGSFSDHLNFVMKAAFQGFSLSEKVHDIFMFENRPQLGLRKLAPKPYETFYFHTDEFGEIIKCVQDMDGKRRDMDLSRFIYFVQNPEFDQHYGQSDLREAYRAWYGKDVTIRFQNLFIEKIAGGLIIGRPKEGSNLTVESREYAILRQIVENMQSMTSVLLPSNIDIEVLNPKSTDVFEKKIQQHDLQIAKALLVPNLLGITHQGQTGSYAQSETQLEAFLWTLDSDANRLEDAMNEQCFQELGYLNFPDGICPKFRFKPVSESKKMELIKAWQELVSGGSVEASDTDEAHLRELLDFPEKGEPLEITPNLDPVPGYRDRSTPPDETIMGEQRKTISAIAMTRATKRVHFSVIDRKSHDIEEDSVKPIEEKLADALAFVISKIHDEKLGTPAGDTRAIENIAFRKGDMTSVRKEIDKVLKKAWDLGTRHATDEIARAREGVFKANMGRIDEDAADFIRLNGFRMLGNFTDLMRSIVQNTLINALKFSWTTKESTNRIYDALTKAGMMSLESNIAATGRELDEIEEAIQESLSQGLHRIRTAVRTNAFQAINEARYSTFTDPELGGFVEALEYSAILDSRTTDICTSLDGRIYPADSPEWDRIRPPNHYNCRSILVPVTVIDTELEGKDKEAGTRWSRPSPKDPQQGFGGQTG